MESLFENSRKVFCFADEKTVLYPTQGVFNYSGVMMEMAQYACFTFCARNA